MRSAMPAVVPPPLGASSPIGPGVGVSVLGLVPSSISIAPPNSFADPGVCPINVCLSGRVDRGSWEGTVEHAVVGRRLMEREERRRLSDDLVVLARIVPDD